MIVMLPPHRLQSTLLINTGLVQNPDVSVVAVVAWEDKEQQQDDMRKNDS